MRSEDLQDAIGMVRQDFVSDAHKNHRAAVWGASAAALCLCAALGVLLLNRPGVETLYESDKRFPEVPSQSCIVPEWEDLTDAERYDRLEYEGLSYLSQGERPIPQTQSVAQVCTVEVRGWRWEDNTTLVSPARLYLLDGVQSSCAVGVQFADGGAVYPYLVLEYRPETLGQMISDLDLEKTLSFGVAECYGFDADGNWHRTQYEVDDALIWEMLLSDRSVPNIADYDSHTFGKTDVDIAVNIPALGYENIAMWTTEDGWLCTNILATGKAFFLGKEKTAAFREYILQNIPGTEVTVSTVENVIPE